MGKNLVRDRIDVRFDNKAFLDTLEQWKNFCKFLNSGQTERLMEIITEDLPKLKEKIIKEHKLR